jgi:hypothetical protein
MRKLVVINKCALMLAMMINSVSLTAALDYSTASHSFDHLTEINKEWKKYSESCPNSVVSFNSDTDRIKFHLTLVTEYLRQHCSSNLNAAQTQNRDYLLNVLEKYTRSSIFPTNHYHSVRQPYFVDNYGVHCAVGYLIAASGYSHLVERIRSDHNYDYIENITTDGLKEWALEHGFTLEELKWIQPTYYPNPVVDPIGDGTDGVVRRFGMDYYHDRVMFAGDFSTVDGIPCYNIGYYEDDQLNCYGNGIIGTVNDLSMRLDGVTAFGELIDAGDAYPVAYYNGSAWTFMEIPGREGAICTAGFASSGSPALEVAISHWSIPGVQEIWYYYNSGTWVKQGEVNGIILDIEGSFPWRVYAGSFDNVHISSGIDTTFSANNVLLKPYSGTWYSVPTEAISDTVKTVRVIGESILLGGTCSPETGQDVCLTRYLNGTFQPLLLRSDFFGTHGNSVNAIAYDDYGTGMYAIIGGNFVEYPGGTYGNNLIELNLSTNQFESLALFNADVTSVEFIDNALIVGGFFTENLGTSLNHLGKVDYILGGNEISDDQVVAYPIPFVDVIYVSGVDGEISYSILNTAGQLLMAGLVSGNIITGLEELPAGLYLLKLQGEDWSSVKRLVKE